VIPLYIGVELILGIAILNKASGIYGILSIITGHPINIWQWLFNVLALLTLPFYMRALTNLKNKPKNGRTTSLACIIYIVDTFVGLLYTFYFMYLWFSEQDVAKRDNPFINANSKTGDANTGKTQELSQQSASPARELFVSCVATIIITGVRFYFTLVFISFTNLLLKQLKNEERYNQDDRDEEFERLILATGFSGKVARFVFNLESRSKEKLMDFFNQ
jgi:hypothetical protein